MNLLLKMSFSVVKELPGFITGGVGVYQNSSWKSECLHDIMCTVGSQNLDLSSQFLPGKLSMFLAGIMNTFSNDIDVLQTIQGKSLKKHSGGRAL